jgi:SpoIVB peptidase S55
LRLTALQLLLSLSAPAGAEEIFPLAQVRPGLRGYGLTVLRGTTPERFEVEVLGVLKNFLPRQDVILTRLDHPVLRQTAVIAGMSGSPVYFDGRLAGAVAYGWSFSKEPIAGVTPIETMLAELDRPVRGPEATPMAVRQGRGLAFPAVERWLAALPLPARSAAPGVDLVRATVPLSAAGLGPTALAEAGRLLGPYGLEPMQAGGSGDPNRGPTSFSPGMPIGVQLARGDVSMVGTGTVTAVRGRHVLAFGHPMFEAGEVYLPIVGAEIHAVLPSLLRSVKLSSPLRELGSLVQDRQSCIIGETGRKAGMLPIEVAVSQQGSPTRTLRAEVVRHRALAPALAALVVGEGVSSAVNDWADTVYTTDVQIDVRGFRRVRLVDHVFSREGVTPRALAASRGLLALGVILNNPFAPVRVDGVRVGVDLAFRSDFAEITDLRVASDEVDPGARINAYATVRPFGGPEETAVVPIEIPRSLAGATLRVEVAAGGAVQPDLAPPESIRDLLDALEKQFPQNAMVVSIYGPDEGVTLRGELVPNLPTSVLDTLRPAASARARGKLLGTARTVIPAGRILAGRAELMLRVRNEVLR